MNLEKIKNKLKKCKYCFSNQALLLNSWRTTRVALTWEQELHSSNQIWLHEQIQWKRNKKKASTYVQRRKLHDYV